MAEEEVVLTLEAEVWETEEAMVISLLRQSELVNVEFPGGGGVVMVDGGSRLKWRRDQFSP